MLHPGSLAPINTVYFSQDGSKLLVGPIHPSTLVALVHFFPGRPPFLIPRQTPLSRVNNVTLLSKLYLTLVQNESYYCPRRFVSQHITGPCEM
jgi:hypothetical protein